MNEFMSSWEKKCSEDISGAPILMPRIDAHMRIHIQYSFYDISSMKDSSSFIFVFLSCVVCAAIGDWSLRMYNNVQHLSFHYILFLWLIFVLQNFFLRNDHGMNWTCDGSHIIKYVKYQIDHRTILHARSLTAYVTIREILPHFDLTWSPVSSS